MVSTLNHVYTLEKYISKNSVSLNPMISKGIDKIIRIEIKRLQNIRQRLDIDLSAYETKHKTSTLEIYELFRQGNAGDEIEIMDWVSTYDMLQNVERNILLLQSGNE